MYSRHFIIFKKPLIVRLIQILEVLKYNKLRINEIWYLGHIYFHFCEVSLLDCWSFVLTSKIFYKLKKVDYVCDMYYTAQFFNIYSVLFFYAEYILILCKFICSFFMSFWILCHYEEVLSHFKIKRK